MKNINIKFGGYQNQNSIHNQAARFFLNQLQENLGDQFTYEFIENVLNIGKNSGDLPYMVKDGELTACYISTVRFTEWVPEICVLDLPFLFKDRNQVQAAFRGEFGNHLKNRFLTNTPFRLLGIWDNGFRHITNKIRPIHRPEDCVGLTIRTQISDVHVESLKAIGFQPIPVDVKVFVDEIDGPRFDGQDNPLTNSFNFGVHNYHRFFTLSGHFFGGTAFICNADIYNQWSKEVQNIVMQSANLATEYQWYLASLEDENILKQIDPKLNEIVTLTDEERSLFKAKVQPVFEKFEKQIPHYIFAMFEENKLDLKS